MKKSYLWTSCWGKGQSLPFNYKAHLWAAENFDQTYKAKWVPQAMPALIFSGDQARA